MRKSGTQKLILLVLLAAVSGRPGCAQTTQSGTDQAVAQSGPQQSIGDPSPDGRYAFVENVADDDTRSVNLIDQKTGKMVKQVADNERGWRVLWSADSTRFAGMLRYGHPNQGVTVFIRHGNTFKEVDLPEINADIPERLKRGKTFTHVAANNWQEAVKWLKNGSLIMTVDSMIDGTGPAVEATRTVTIRFGKGEKPEVLNSSVKYDTESE